MTSFSNAPDDFLWYSEKSEKQAKRDAKKVEKQAKKAVHKSEAGIVPNTESGAGDNEADHSEGKYGTKEMNMSRDKPAIKLINVDVLSEKLKDQDVWVRGRLHTSRAKGNEQSLISFKYFLFATQFEYRTTVGIWNSIIWNT